jgi:glycosyltransferase involved in cell wall biosynthesis
VSYRITVIVPCFNQANYLPETIHSVIQQTYSNWECIIVNDGSLDNTEDVALGLCKADHRIHYLRKENGGVASARNAGIAAAKTEFILPLDADDKIHREYISNALSIFIDYPTTSLVYAGAEYFDSVNRIWELPAYDYKTLLLRNLIYCSAIFRKEDWQRIGFYDEALKEGWEDWEFWIRLLKGGKEVYKIPQVRFYYRQRTRSMLKQLLEDDAKSRLNENYIFSKNQAIYEEYFGSIIENLNNAFKLQAENERLKKSFAYKMSYPIMKLINKVT